MKTILSKFYHKNNQIINIIALMLSSFFVTFLDNSFNLNPFVIFCILFSAKIGNYFAMIFTIVSLIAGAFLKNISYGIEIALVSSLVVFCLALPKFKIRKYSLFIIIGIVYSILSPLYLVSSFTFQTGRQIITSLIVSLILISFLQYKKPPTIINYSVFLLIPGALINIPILFTVGLFLSTIILLKIEKLETRLSLVLISTIINYAYFLLPTEQIILICLPLIIACLIPKVTIRSYTYIGLVCILTISKYPTTFYKSIDFYLPIMSLLIYLIFEPNNLVEAVKPNEETMLLSRIKNIEEYVSLIEESSPSPVLDKSNLVENLKIKSCFTCNKKAFCCIPNSLESNLPSNLTSTFKRTILTNCPNGSKMIYRYKIVEEMVNLELKENLVVEERHNALKGIITPLKTLCEPKIIDIDKDSLNHILQGDYIYSLDNEGLYSYNILSKGQIGKIEEFLLNRLAINYHFDFINHLYYYPLLKDLKDHFLVKSITRGFTKTNGDASSYYQKDGDFEFFLIDAMGHFESAAKHSHFAQRLLELGRINKKTPTERIEELNNIILYQNSNENYVTLDFLFFDKRNKKLFLYKYGSSSTYLFHDNKVIPFENTSLPLGIVPYQKLKPLEIEYSLNDKLLFFSDGLDKLNDESILDIFNGNKTIETALDEYGKTYGFNDDATIALITII